MYNLRLLMIFFAGLMISCKNEVEQKDIKTGSNVQIEEQLPISLDFADTIFANKIYNGKINYKNDLDTITTSLDDVKKYRFIHYAYTGTKTLHKDLDSLKRIIRDTTWAKTNNVINLKNILFRKSGTYYIDGIITDEVSIEDGTMDKNGKPMVRIITNEFRLSKKVIVIDESK